MTRCALPIPLDHLSAHNRAEIEKFTSWISLEASRRAGGDSGALNALEQALYPEGIGREPEVKVEA